ncbi:MAG: DUF2339 domain-containing protein [Acidobacteriota bacterium]|nr:DUF2339 domain-containing protein [Acidobacteriota bacterium]
MFTFLALVVAVIALKLAMDARRELRELREEVVASRLPVVDQPSAREPVAPVPTPAGNREPATGNIPAYTPPPPAPPSPTPAPAPAPAAASWNIDWENLVGIKLFSWIAGIALVLAAVFLFKYSVDHGWLRPALRAGFGLATGIGLLVVCELRIARNYRFTANAMDGAGIAILYATLFALHGRWHLWPAPAAFFGMLIVTAIAVVLSTRRDSVFIALLGLLGGFATPALLSSGENRPIALFSYLLLLNGGISWIAFRKRWPLLTALSLGLTVVYQWAWIERFLTTGQLPLAATIFLVFAAIGASSLWPRGDDPKAGAFRMIAGAGAVLPLLFAFFTAIVPEYGARYNVLLGFLLLITAGLAAIAMWRGPEWLHALGGLASLLTFFIWLTVSYTSSAWPGALLWLAGFVALYLAADLRMRSVAAFTSGLLFFVFVGLALHERARYATLLGAMFALLTVIVVFALMRSRPFVAAVALAFSSTAIMTLTSAPAWLVCASHVAIFALVFVLDWSREEHELAAAALPFLIAAQVVVSYVYAPSDHLEFALAMLALFVGDPAMLRRRVGASLLPHTAAIVASFLFFLVAYRVRIDLAFEDFIGVVPIALALTMFALLLQLLRYDALPARAALVASAALAFLTIAAPVQLDRTPTLIAWAIEAAALAWLFTRIRHAGIAWWSGGLMVVVLGGLLIDPRFDHYAFTYVLIAAAMFFAAWIAPGLRNVAASAGTIELFTLLNVAIYDHYSTAGASPLSRDLTYTIAWALFAIAMLVTGIILGSRAARVSALGLLLVTVLKCFLHDLAQLGGLYRVASLFGLAVSLVLVGLMLQKFVMMKRADAEPTTP